MEGIREADHGDAFRGRDGERRFNGPPCALRLLNVLGALIAFPGKLRNLSSGQ